jgi:hypothetical protein
MPEKHCPICGYEGNDPIEVFCPRCRENLFSHPDFLHRLPPRNYWWGFLIILVLFLLFGMYWLSQVK